MGYGTDPEVGGYGKDPEAPLNLSGKKERVRSPLDVATDGIGDLWGNTLGGAIKGASRIGDTLLTPIDAAARAMGIQNDFIGRNDRGAAVDDFMRESVSPDSAAYMVGDFGAQMAGTAGAGAALGVGARALNMGRLANALETGGMATGATAKGFAQKAGDIGIRTAGGAIGGASAAGMIDPNAAGVGALVGGALPLPLQGVGKAYQRYFGGARNAAGVVANQAAAGQVDDVLRAYDNAAPGLTAGQASVSAESPMTSALAKVAQREGQSAEYAAIFREQQRLRAQAAMSIAKTPEQYALAKAELDRVTGPMREINLNAADEAGAKVPYFQNAIDEKFASNASALQNQGQMATTAAQQGVLADNFVPVPGQPRVAGRLSNNIDRVPEFEGGASDAGVIAKQRQAELAHRKMQLDSLEAYGLTPLDASGITGQIDRILRTPGDRIVTMNQRLLSGVKDKIAEAAAMNGGQVSARDLYAIRKTEINDIVEGLSKNPDDGTKQRAAKLVASLKSQIDDAIENAGGTGWRDYLKTYEKMAGQLDEMKVGARLQQALTDPTGREKLPAFSAELRRMIQKPNKNTGEPMINSLSELNLQKVGKIQADAERETRFADLAKQGAGELSTVLGNKFAPLELPNTLNRSVTITNKLLDLIQHKASEKTMNQLSILMQDPAAVAKAMREVGPNERARIAQLMALRYPANALAAQ